MRSRSPLTVWRRLGWWTGVGTACMLMLVFCSWPAAAAPAYRPVELGAAGSFGVLAGTAVTNTGPSLVGGDVGVSPGDTVSGFPPGEVPKNTVHVNDAVAEQAQSALTAAYNDAAGRTPTTVLSGDIGGRTLLPGVYRAVTPLQLNGTLTLDGRGDLNAVFIFQLASLVTGPESRVSPTGGTAGCNVFWQVGGTATLGAYSEFRGSIMALESATLQQYAVVLGQVLVRNGPVSLNANQIYLDGPCVLVPSPRPSPTPTTIIPSGYPETGAGGAWQPVGGTPTDLGLLTLGGLLGGAAVAIGQVVHRRRMRRATHWPDGDR